MGRATGGSPTTTIGIPAGANGAACGPRPGGGRVRRIRPRSSRREAPIGPDGTLEVNIDTSLAQAPHPDQDQSYQIQAEVVDMSRRTIVGTGEVLVAREPFQVFAWVDRGYYRVGDTVIANFAARRLDGQAVEGKGKLRLLKISYPTTRPGSRSKQKFARGTCPPTPRARPSSQSRRRKRAAIGWTTR